MMHLLSQLRWGCVLALVSLPVVALGSQEAAAGQVQSFARPLVDQRAEAIKLPAAPADGNHGAALEFLRKLDVDTPAVPLMFDPATYKSQHPRLPILDGDALDRFRRNTSVFNTYTGYAKAITDPAVFNNLQNSSALLMVALATGEQGYFDMVKRLIESPLPNYGTQTKIYFIAYAYDWFYSRFTSAEKARYQKILYNLLLDLETELVATQPSPLNDVGYNRFEGGLLTASIALYPDHPRGQEHLEFAITYSNDILETARQIMGRTGGWHEGTDYYNIGISKVIPRMLWEWRTASGQDLFRQNPWVEGAIFFSIYKMRPDITPSRVADINLSYMVADNAVWPLSIEYRNPYGLWFARRMTMDVAGYIGAQRKPNGVDPSLYPWGYPDWSEYAEAPPGDLPKAWIFEGIGEVVMRSGWTEDDTVLEFKAGPSFWSHSDLDNGAFTIYRRGALAINSGAYAYYGDEHHLNYKRQTISKNSMTVYDPADTFTTVVERPLANDGGQRRIDGYFGVGAPSIYDERLALAYEEWSLGGGAGRLPSPSSASSLQLWKNQGDTFLMGRITAFDTNKEYGFVSADLTRAYTNEQSGSNPIHRTRRVRQWNRSLLFAGYKYVVLFDQVSSYNADFKKRWLLHTINEPAVNGKDVSALRDDLVTSSFTFARGLQYASPNFKQYQYNGKLQMRSLLPAEAQIAKVGGPGREFEVDGQNYGITLAVDPWRSPAGVISTDPKKGPGEPGAWRLEISPPAPAEDDVFLNVLYPSETNGPPMPPTLALTGEGYRGLVLEDAEQPWVILFLNSGASAGPVSYTAGLDREARHWLGNLTPGQYRLLCNDQVVGDGLIVGPEGVLSIKAPGAGAFQLIPLPQETAPVEPEF